MSDDFPRLAKLKRRIGNVSSQAHLDKIMASFTDAEKILVVSEVSGMLREGLTLTKGESDEETGKG